MNLSASCFCPSQSKLGIMAPPAGSTVPLQLTIQRGSCVATSRFFSVFCYVYAARVGTQHITMLFFKCFHFCECSACERSGTVIGAALGSLETRVVSVKLKLELSFSMKTYIPMAYIHCTCMDFLKPVLKNVLTTFNHN